MGRQTRPVSYSIFDIRKSLFFRQYSQTIHSGIPADRKLVCNIFSLPNSENRIRIGWEPAELWVAKRVPFHIQWILDIGYSRKSMFFVITHRRCVADHPLTGNSCATFCLCKKRKPRIVAKCWEFWAKETTINISICTIADSPPPAISPKWKWQVVMSSGNVKC